MTKSLDSCFKIPYYMKLNKHLIKLFLQKKSLIKCSLIKCCVNFMASKFRASLVKFCLKFVRSFYSIFNTIMEQ